MRKFERIVFTDEERRNDEYEDLKMLHKQLKYFLEHHTSADSDLYRYAGKMYELTDMSVKMERDRFNSLLNSLSNYLDEDDYEKYLDEDDYEEPVAERWFEEDDDEELDDNNSCSEYFSDPFKNEKDTIEYRKVHAECIRMLKYLGHLRYKIPNTYHDIKRCTGLISEFCIQATHLKEDDFKKLVDLFDDFYKEEETETTSLSGLIKSTRSAATSSIMRSRGSCLSVIF